MSGPDVGSSINDVHPLPEYLQAAAIRTVCDRAMDSLDARTLLAMLDLEPAIVRRTPHV